MVVTALSSTLPKKTAYIGVAPEVKELKDADDVEWKVDPVVKQFIENAPQVKIKAGDVKDLDEWELKLKKYDKLFEEMEAVISKLKDDQKFFKAESKRLSKELERFK